MRQLIFKQFISKIYDSFFSVDLSSQELKITDKTRCLLLASHASEETISCGGLMLKYPQNFDVYCLTNGFKDVQVATLTYEEKVALRKKDGRMGKTASFCPSNKINYSKFIEFISYLFCKLHQFSS